MIRVRQTDVYVAWFDSLRDRRARARIDIRIRRLELGNPGDVRPVGQGVSEMRVDHGPGYRLYFKQSGTEVVLLLCGGDKSSQRRDIATALFGGGGVSMALNTLPWDVVDHLTDDEAIAAYLDAAMEDGDPKLIAAALADIARAKGIVDLPARTGLSRDDLDRALSTGDPALSVILKIISALGLQLAAVQTAASSGVERGYLLVGRFISAFAQLESQLDEGIAKLLGVNDASSAILADNMSMFNKLRVIESVAKANFSGPDGTEFQSKKDARLKLFKEIMRVNDRRVMVAHRPFEFRRDRSSIVFRFHTAKGTLVNESNEIFFSEFEKEIISIGQTTAMLRQFVEDLNPYEPSLDFSDSRNSGYLMLL